MNSESDTARYRVVLHNEYDAADDIDDIRQKICARFKLNEKVANHVFAGRPVVVKNNTSANTAFKFKNILDDIGAANSIELMPDIDDTDGSGYLERRHREQRERPNRRGRVRDGQIVPDRRIGDRRKQD